MNLEIMKIAREKGLLLEKSVLDLLCGFERIGDAREFLEGIERYSGQKLITKDVLVKNIEYLQRFADGMRDKKKIADGFSKLGIEIKISAGDDIGDDGDGKEGAIKDEGADVKEGGGGKRHYYKIMIHEGGKAKKLEVGDFVGHFRARYHQLQRILMQRPDLSTLMSINKISGERQNFSIIGIVKDKRKTKNNNLFVSFEDLTGEISVLFKPDREAFKKAEELVMDEVVGVKVSGNRDWLYGQEIYFPDAYLAEKMRFDDDISIAFVSDMHCGSTRHLKKSLNNFIEWINSDDADAKKIKYLFINGDNVDGVGIFPSQEGLLNLRSMKEQYDELAGYLSRIPKRITIFMCPGQHDATRVAEPQPAPERKYADVLYKMENLVLVSNPCLVKLFEGEKEFKVQMYHGASVHPMIDEIPELRELKAHRCPAKAVKHLLKRRHLAPMHGVSASIVYIPNSEKDALVITEVPDIVCVGEMHRLDIENYNGILIIVGSCWQAQTPFEEKVGNIPDPGKVPVFNLKTRELKIFDFGDAEEINRDFVPYEKELREERARKGKMK